MKKAALVATISTIAWLAFVFIGGFYGLWMHPVVASNDSEGFARFAQARLQESNRGSSALVLVEAGEPVARFYASPDETVDANTLFAAASMSKWFAAHAVMKLVEEGRVELDAPLARYLTRWQLPVSDFDNDAVTIRRLLSHTAGLGDGLGFGDYAASESLPELEQALSHPRASSGKTVRIAVTAEPGSEWKYSGGGYLLLELLVEEVSGQTFEAYVREAIFQPLGMSDAGYDFIESYANNAASYAADGSRVASYQYASSAATGLVISSADLTRFVLAQLRPDLEGVLSASTVESMREAHGSSLGADIWGLGTMLYAPTPGGDFVYGHDGANEPAINTAVRINPDSGDALIVLLTGHPGLASHIGSEWVLWQTGYPDVLAVDAVLESMLLPALAGCALILLALLFRFMTARARRRRGPAAKQ